MGAARGDRAGEATPRGVPSQFLSPSTGRSFLVRAEVRMPAGGLFAQEAIVELMAGEMPDELREWRRGQGRSDFSDALRRQGTSDFGHRAERTAHGRRSNPQAMKSSNCHRCANYRALPPRSRHHCWSWPPPRLPDVHTAHYRSRQIARSLIARIAELLRLKSKREHRKKSRRNNAEHVTFSLEQQKRPDAVSCVRYRVRLVDVLNRRREA